MSSPADDDLWEPLERVEVEQVGWAHAKQMWAEGRKPHERCRTCGDAWPCPSLRLARKWLLADDEGVRW